MIYSNFSNLELFLYHIFLGMERKNGEVSEVTKFGSIYHTSITGTKKVSV